MKLKIILVAMVFALSGCLGLQTGPGGSILYSSPEAGAMRACASGIDVFTPGISVRAIPDLLRGNVATLGETAEEGMSKCLWMLRGLRHIPQFDPS